MRTSDDLHTLDSPPQPDRAPRRPAVGHEGDRSRRQSDGLINEGRDLSGGGGGGGGRFFDEPGPDTTLDDPELRMTNSFRSPSYLDSNYVVDLDLDPVRTYDYPNLKECRREVPWILSAMVLFVIFKSLASVLQSRAESTYPSQYPFVYQALFHSPFVTIIIWPFVLFSFVADRFRSRYDDDEYEDIDDGGGDDRKSGGSGRGRRGGGRRSGRGRLSSSGVASKTRKRRRVNYCAPWRILRFLILAVLENVAFLLTMIPFEVMPEGLSVLLGFLILPFTAIMNYLHANLRYSVYNIIGVSLSVIGIFLVAWPRLQFYTNSNGLTWYGYLLSILVTFLANAIFAFSCVLKQQWLQHDKMNLWNMVGWVAIFSIFFKLFVFLVAFIPIPHAPLVTTPKEWPTHVLDGLKCIIGQKDMDDSCHYLWVVYLCYLLLDCFQHVTMLSIFKLASANLALLTRLIAIPLASIILDSPTIAGRVIRSEFYSMGVYDIIGFVVFTVASVTYFVRLESQATDVDGFLVLKKKIKDALCGCCRKKKRQETVRVSKFME